MDCQANRRASTHAGGYGAVSLTYGTSNTSVTDANGNIISYNFTTNQYRMRKMVSKTLDGKTKSYTYPGWSSDNQQRPKTITDENGVVTQYTYNNHHKTKEIRAHGTSAARTYDFEYLDETSDRLTKFKGPSVKSGSIREVVTAYDSNDLPTSVTINGFTPSARLFPAQFQ